MPTMPLPTRGMGEVVQVVRFLAKAMIRKGQLYKRGGVGLTDLVRADLRQADLFSAPTKKA